MRMCARMYVIGREGETEEGGRVARRDAPRNLVISHPCRWQSCHQESSSSLQESATRMHPLSEEEDLCTGTDTATHGCKDTDTDTETEKLWHPARTLAPCTSHCPFRSGFPSLTRDLGVSHTCTASSMDLPGCSAVRNFFNTSISGTTIATT